MKVYVIRKNGETTGIYSTWQKASEAIDMILYFIEMDTGHRPTSDYTITEVEVR